MKAKLSIQRDRKLWEAKCYGWSGHSIWEKRVVLSGLCFRKLLFGHWGELFCTLIIIDATWASFVEQNAGIDSGKHKAWTHLECCTRRKVTEKLVLIQTSAGTQEHTEIFLVPHTGWQVIIKVRFSRKIRREISQKIHKIWYENGKGYSPWKMWWFFLQLSRFTGSSNIKWRDLKTREACIFLGSTVL